MTGLLLDTHIWYWYLSGSERLPTGLKNLLDSSPSRSCWLSPISVWELGLLVRRGRVKMDQDYRRWLATASKHFPLKDASLTREVSLRSLEIDLPHRDPADRFLAATAQTYDLTLLTVDRHLRSAKGFRTLHQ